MAKLTVTITYTDDHNDSTTITRTFDSDSPLGDLSYDHETDIMDVLVDIDNKLIENFERMVKI